LNLQKIIEGCTNGSGRSQEELYNLLANEMFAVCLYYSHDYAEAQDTLHEGFMKVFKNIASLKGEGALKAWVRRIMINTALEKYRKKNPLYLVDQNELREFEDIDRENIISNISADELIKMIQELSPQYRMVFNLYALEGYSHKEISDMLGISEGTSKSNLARARSILQRKVKKYFYVSSQQVNG